jgi:hypothetical protein
MILAALVIGLITAYAYGPRVGLWAAGAALALLLVAALVPAAVLPVYAVVGVGVAATSAAAARRGPHVRARRAVDLARAGIRAIRARRRSD